jgi:hypothetical protein
MTAAGVKNGVRHFRNYTSIIDKGAPTSLRAISVQKRDRKPGGLTLDPNSVVRHLPK